MLQIKITMLHYIESFGELISDKQYKFNKTDCSLFSSQFTGSAAPSDISLKSDRSKFEPLGFKTQR